MATQASNPFYVKQGYADFGGGLQDVVKDYTEKKKAEEQKAANIAKMQEAKEVINSGDNQAIADFMLVNPGISEQVNQNLGIRSDMQKQGAISDAKKILLSNDPRQDMVSRVQRIAESGGDATQSIQLLNKTPDEMKSEALTYLSLNDPKSADAYRKSQAGPEVTKKQMGTGAMAGYVFDPATGSFSIDQGIKSDLEGQAARKRNEAELKGKLVDVKTRQSINKDFGSLIKDSVMINKAAKSLSSLKSNSTPTDQLAAIFKFMKSLDPTSVVREGEQQMAQSTGGPADYLVGVVNNLQGGGKLTPEAFQNMVNTSKVLSDSAVSSANSEANSYLDVYGDTLPEKMKGNLVKRIPTLFNQGQPQQGGQAPPQSQDLSNMSMDQLMKMRQQAQ